MKRLVSQKTLAMRVRLLVPHDAAVRQQSEQIGRVSKVLKIARCMERTASQRFFELAARCSLVDSVGAMIEPQPSFTLDLIGEPTTRGCREFFALVTNYAFPHALRRIGFSVIFRIGG